MLATTRSVIIDEIHATAPNKRGAHLALSLERLADLCGDRLVRIGLSGTQKPIEAGGDLRAGGGPGGVPSGKLGGHVHRPSRARGATVRASGLPSVDGRDGRVR